MSIWKEIKYSINSTLGTKTFQPLDKYLRAVQTINFTDYKEIVQYAENGTQYLLYKGKPIICCTESDKATYKQQYPGYEILTYSDAPHTMFKAQMLNSGSVLFDSKAQKVSGETYYSSAAYDNDWYDLIKIKINNIEVSCEKSSSGFIIPFNKGDIIEVILNADERFGFSSIIIENNSNSQFTPCIYGKTVTTPAIDYINWEEVTTNE